MPKHESTIRYEFNVARINALTAFDNAKFADEQAWVPDPEFVARAARRLQDAAAAAREAALKAEALAAHYEDKARYFDVQ